MRLLVDLSSLSRGGVVQASLSFLGECKKQSEHQYLVIVVQKYFEEVMDLDLPLNFQVRSIKIESSKSIIKLWYLYLWAFAIKADLVFTPYGPTLWRPLRKHFVGFVLPFLVYPESVFFKL